MNGTVSSSRRKWSYFCCYMFQVYIISIVLRIICYPHFFPREEFLADFCLFCLGSVLNHQQLVAGLGAKGSKHCCCCCNNTMQCNSSVGSTSTAAVFCCWLLFLCAHKIYISIQCVSVDSTSFVIYPELEATGVRFTALKRYLCSFYFRIDNETGGIQWNTLYKIFSVPLIPWPR